MNEDINVFISGLLLIHCHRSSTITVQKSGVVEKCKNCGNQTIRYYILH